MSVHYWRTISLEALGAYNLLRNRAFKPDVGSHIQTCPNKPSGGYSYPEPASISARLNMLKRFKMHPGRQVEVRKRCLQNSSNQPTAQHHQPPTLQLKLKIVHTRLPVRWELPVCKACNDENPKSRAHVMLANAVSTLGSRPFMDSRKY